MKKTIVAIYTGKGLADPLEELIHKLLPEFRLISVIDDNLIGECVAAGSMTREIKGRLLSYYKCAEAMGADVILNTCSSVGDAVYEGRELVKTPIVRIDEAMARLAVASFSKIAVVATLNTTLDPTLRLLEREANKSGRKIEAVSGLATGAYQALIGGNPQKHDQLILDTVSSLASQGVECVLLAQASMLRMEKALNEVAGIPVYASPALCLADIAKEY